MPGEPHAQTQTHWPPLSPLAVRARREVDAEEPGVSSPAHILGDANNLSLRVCRLRRRPGRFVSNPVSTTLQGGCDENLDRLAAPLLTSTFARVGGGT